MSQQIEKVSFKKLANFTERQMEAWQALRQYKYLLYGGAMGGGKSRFIRWALLARLMSFYAALGIRGVRSGLFCEDYPALEDRQISKIVYEFPDWLGKLNKADHEFVLNPEYGSGVLCFRNLDNAAKYQSAEFADIGVDELTKNPQDVFAFLRTRLRWPGIEDNKFLGATNPGDIGHTWVRNLFIDKLFDPNEQEGKLFGFVQALASDNPFISGSYLRTLDSLPEEMRRAYRDGDWDVFKGQYFTEWRKQLHGIRSYLPDSQRDEVFGSMDWGFSPDSFAYHLHAAINVHTKTADFTRVITFAELYGRQKYPKDWSGDIKALEDGFAVTNRYADPSAGNRHPSWTAKEAGGDSVLAEFALHGIDFIAGNNDKKNGFQAMRNWMSIAPDGLPYWQITEACPNLIKQIPAAVYDDNNSFIVKEGGEDHALSSARYGMISQPFNHKVVAVPVVPMSADWFDEMERRQHKAEGVFA